MVALSVPVEDGPRRPSRCKTKQVPASICHAIHGFQLKAKPFKIWKSSGLHPFACGHSTITADLRDADGSSGIQGVRA